MKQLSRLLVTLGALVAGLSAIAVASANGAGGVTGPAFYVDGELYRTVGTPLIYLVPARRTTALTPSMT